LFTLVLTYIYIDGFIRIMYHKVRKLSSNKLQMLAIELIRKCLHIYTYLSNALDYIFHTHRKFRSTSVPNIPVLSTHANTNTFTSYGRINFIT